MNNFGQLGLGIEDSSYSVDTSIIKDPSILTPQLVPKVANAGGIFHIACGGAHTVVIDEFGSTFATGSNSCGISIYLSNSINLSSMSCGIYIYLTLYLSI
jgi:alpha-tubulin suppressor-like RCC1 family protein